MSLDIYIGSHSQNITHNLGGMADALGIYDALWNPAETGILKAEQLIPLLNVALDAMKENPDRYKKYDAPNGWGRYDDFLPWLERLLQACVENPEASVSSRT